MTEGNGKMLRYFKRSYRS